MKPFGLHDLRRSFVTDLLDDGHDIEMVARLCGHASVDTTARYFLHIDREAAKISRARDLPMDPWNRENDDS